MAAELTRTCRCDGTQALHRIADPCPADLQYRVDRIEAILRDHGMHEPGCPVRNTEKSQGWYVPPEPCTCWMAESVGGGTHARGGPITSPTLYEIPPQVKGGDDE